MSEIKNDGAGMPVGIRLSKEDADFIGQAVKREKELRTPGPKTLIPYRLFHGLSSEPPNHHALSGGIAPADWPFWDLYAPPLGPGCSCALMGISAARARRMLESGEAFDLTKRVPEGAGPDEGWNRTEGWWEKL